MKTTLNIVASICLTLGATADSPDPAKPFVISGLYRVVESSVEEDVDSTTGNLKEIDLSTATIEVTYETTNETGDLESVVLTSGKFTDNQIELRGTLDTPTKVQITVQGAKDERLSKTTILKSGDDISFAVVEQKDPYLSNFLILMGKSQQSIDDSKIFTVYGNLPHTNIDLSMARLDIRGTQFEDGIKTMFDLGYVMLEDDRFSIEGDVDVPQAVTINLDSGSEYWSTPAVIEPGSVITVSWDESKSLLIASAINGRHKKLVESWQISQEYIAKAKEVVAARAKLALKPGEGTVVADLVKKELIVDGESTPKTTVGSDAEDERVDSVEAEKEKSAPPIQQATNIPKVNTPQPAPGCDHVSMDDVQISIRDLIRANATASETGRLRQEQFQIQKTALQSLAKTSEDPLDSLLAMELGAFRVSDKNVKEAFPIFERLAEELDSDLVAQRVIPQRDLLAQNIAIELNEESLIQGQKVPDFTLSNMEGEDIALYPDVLQENKIVLIDFWASWCGPCIAMFPHLKSIYHDYKENGFEIVSVSLDSESIDWTESSEQQQLPWVNLGELKGMKGPTAVDYGVQFIPKSYLVDMDGCILKKDLHPEMLKDLLVKNL